MNAQFKIEPKDKLNMKAQITNIDWSIDGRLICAAFKQENMGVAWNINTCEKLYTFNAAEHHFGNISKVMFYSLNPDYMEVSGDQAVLVHMATNRKVVVSQNSEQGPTSGSNEKPIPGGHIKRKGASIKQSSFLLRDILHKG